MTTKASCPPAEPTYEHPYPHELTNCQACGNWHTLPDPRAVVPCPACDGKGEIGTHQDYWGNWDTEQCRACDGTGEVMPYRFDEIKAALAEATS